MVGLSAAAQIADIAMVEGRASGQINVPVGQSITVTTPEPFSRLVLGDPAIADVVPFTDSSFGLSGREVGRTNLTIFDDAGEVAGLIDVEVARDVGDLQRTIAQAVPGASVRVGSVNGRLHLAGSVPDAVALQRVLDIAQQYGSEPVINALQVASPQQVLLEVRLIEASRNAEREIGVSWLARDGNAATGAGTDGLLRLNARQPSGSEPFGSVVARVLGAGIDADILIQALEENGLARRLAEPNLVALSGEEASFLAGGEIPIPVAEQDGQTVIEFKEFGVRLSFTPTVLDNGLINLLLEPEVSQIDDSVTVQTGNIAVPGFTSRRVRTTVELRSGQSFAIAGLLQTDDVSVETQVPLLGDLPVIGALFRSTAFQREETDLVVIVTPHLARPSEPGVALATPFDRSRPASDLELFLLGRQEVGRRDLVGFAKGEGVSGPYGHILELDP